MRFCCNGGKLTQNFRYKESPHQPFFFSETRLNNLSYGIKIWTHLSIVLSQFTRVSDGRTDGQTEFLSLDGVCILFSAVKTKDKH